jgi:hypothetical protein
MREEAPSELEPVLARLRLCPSMHVLAVGRHCVRTVYRDVGRRLQV